MTAHTGGEPTNKTSNINYDWIRIQDMLGIAKHTTKITSSDLVNRVLLEFGMWETFIMHYSMSMGFSVQI